MSARRKNKRKLLPQGIPDLMFQSPADYGQTDFKVIVPQDLFDDAAACWASPNSSVRHLVPLPIFAALSDIYVKIGSPELTHLNIWDVYMAMRARIDATIQAIPYEVNAPQKVDLLPGYGEFAGAVYAVGHILSSQDQRPSNDDNANEDDNVDDDFMMVMSGIEDVNPFPGEPDENFVQPMYFADFTDDEDDEGFGPQ